MVTGPGPQVRPPSSVPQALKIFRHSFECLPRLVNSERFEAISKRASKFA